MAGADISRSPCSAIPRQPVRLARAERRLQLREWWRPVLRVLKYAPWESPHRGKRNIDSSAAL